MNSKVGGLSNGSAIWLSVQDYYYDTLGKIYVETLHHEFSSCIFKRVDKLLRQEWLSFSKIYKKTLEYFTFCLDYPDACSGATAEALNDGLLSLYSLTDEENDFNIYAETLFTDPKSIKENAKKYPAVAKKLEIFKKFYKKLGFVGKFPDET